MGAGGQGPVTASLEETPIVRALARVAAAARALNDELPLHVERDALRRSLAQLDLETGSAR